MPRDIPIGNGRLLAAFDLDYRIRELYFPRVGKENHAMGYPWRFGVWVDGAFSWVSRREWQIHRGYIADTLVTSVTLTNPRLSLRLVVNDLIDYEKDILVRRVRARNLADHPVDARLFFHADLNCLENEIGDTVFFDPKNACLVHYKGPRYFMMSCASPATFGVTHFATGKKRQPEWEGTWRDAEDGELSGNPIAQGSVDSVIGIHLPLAAGGESVCHYWMAVGRSYPEAEALHRFATIETDPDRLIERNIDYWEHWLSQGKIDGDLLPSAVIECYKRSLLIIKTQIDEGGAIIAANDTDIRQFNLDTYSYMWPRDGAIVAQTLDRAGYGNLSAKFLEFCTHKAARYNYSASILTETGFLMHKYNPDGSVGSSWHPWFAGEEIQLPIQEDETALVIWAIWHHYLRNRDIEAIRHFYNPYVEQAADFLLAFRDEHTGLPLPSYDLWEERRGVFVYTAAAVVAGLKAAANLANLFHDGDRARGYEKGAAEVKEAIDRYLYCHKEGWFGRGIVCEGRQDRRDPTLDASVLGLVLFGSHDCSDSRVASTMQAMERRLWVKGPIGGLARYEEDAYQRTYFGEGVAGNPWLISTLWLAQYKIAAARDRKSLQEILPLLLWAVERTLPSGVLPEQVHPVTGEFLSVSPLTWSHAAFVAAVLDYVEKVKGAEQNFCST